MTRKQSINTNSNNNNNNNDNRRLLFAFALISTGLAAGNALGWPALRKSLIRQGTDLDETALGQIYTVGAWSLYGSRLFIGILRDTVGGTRITTCLSLLAAAAGSLGLALSDARDATSLSVSMAFVGFGGGVQLCQQPVADLFEQDSQGIILSSITGAFSVSVIVFLVLTTISDDRQSVFSGFALLLLVLVVIAAVILPKGHFVEKEQGDAVSANSETEATAEFKAPSVELEHEDDPTLEQAQEANCVTAKDDEPSLVEVLKSSEYIWLLIYFSVTLTGLNFYVGTIGYQLEQKGDHDAKYTNVFVILCAAVAVLSPFPGRLSDQYGVAVLQGLALIGLSTSFFVLASKNASLETGQVIGFTIYAIARIMALSSFFINVANRFGYKHYGRLVGGGLLISATFGLVQMPLLRISSSGGDVPVSLSFGIALLSLLPYCVWLGLRERKQGKSCAETETSGRSHGWMRKLSHYCCVRGHHLAPSVAGSSHAHESMEGYWDNNSWMLNVTDEVEV